MCLSDVYIEQNTPDKLVVGEVEHLKVDGVNVNIRTLFGESKNLEGYFISEVNLVENFLILSKSGDK